MAQVINMLTMNSHMNSLLRSPGRLRLPIKRTAPLGKACCYKQFGAPNRSAVGHATQRAAASQWKPIMASSCANLASNSGNPVVAARQGNEKGVGKNQKDEA